MTILEKNNINGKWQVRVAISDSESVFFNFVNEPTNEEVEKAVSVYEESKIKTIDLVMVSNAGKTQSLKDAENNFILFMRELGLPDKASSEDLQYLCSQLESYGMELEAIKIAVKSLALINDVTQNGGKWADIIWNQ